MDRVLEGEKERPLDELSGYIDDVADSFEWLYNENTLIR